MLHTDAIIYLDSQQEKVPRNANKSSSYISRIPEDSPTEPECLPHLNRFSVTSIHSLSYSL